MEKINIGLYGIGLDTYWPQFDGLETRLTGYLEVVEQKINLTKGVSVINAGLVDRPERSSQTIELFKTNCVEAVFIYISTYALSSTVLPIVKSLNVPVFILNLQPVPAINYEQFNELGDRGVMTGEWLAHCQACSLPEICNVFNRAEIDYEIITGFLEDEESWLNIKNWIEALVVQKRIENNRICVMGRPYTGMLDVYTDITKMLSVFGGYLDFIEMDELVNIRNKLIPTQIEEKKKEFSKIFDVSEECSEYEIDRAAKTSAALDELVKKYNFGSIAYYYEGQPDNMSEDVITSMIAGNTLLTGRNIPSAGEFEIKNMLAMKILDSFNAGGSFSEFYAMDFNEDIVLLGHDGPAHFAISEGKVKLVPLPVYHGKPGKGLSIQMTVKHGPVTLLSVCQDADGFFFLIAEGESVPGSVLMIGNTNSRYKFSIGSKDFINRWSKAGPAHHCAIGIGHISKKLECLGALLSIPVIKIC